jgi:hypothetical protein
MTSQTMSVIGAVGAALTFMTANLPADTPTWVTVVMGGICAGVTVYLGKSHPGKKKL